MRKISAIDQESIIRLLGKWTKAKPLTWEALRTAIIEVNNGTFQTTWSRQALSDNDDIRSAYSASKRRLKLTISDAYCGNASQQTERILQLESQLSSLQDRFDKLKLRHTQLIYNASLLEGGAHLLDDPLPDNTRAQGG